MAAHAVRALGWMASFVAGALLWLVVFVIAVLLGAILGAAGPANAATFTVDSTGDAGDASAGDGTCATAGAVCTLRAAIEEANALSGTDAIEFGISGTGPHTITVATALPAVTGVTTINCATQSGTVCCSGTDCSAAVWKVKIDRADGTNGGLELGAANSSINGCEVANVAGSNTSGYGIVLSGNTTTATCNYVHGSWGGIVAQGVGATIGGAGADDANLTSDNNFGATCTGDDAVIRGNLSGTNAAGSAAVPNDQYGVYVEGGDGATITGNVSSGNTGRGIYVKTGVTNATISSNLVGRDRADTADLCNQRGVQIEDNGTGTTLTSNTEGDCPAVGCCNMSGLEGFGVTCFDYTLGSVTQQSDCEAFGGTALDYNPNAVCDPDFGGVCPTVAAPTSTATATATPTATPTDTPTATPTDTPTATATSTDTAIPTNTATPTNTGTNTATATPSDTPTQTRTPTITNTPAPVTPAGTWRAPTVTPLWAVPASTPVWSAPALTPVWVGGPQ